MSAAIATHHSRFLLFIQVRILVLLSATTVQPVMQRGRVRNGRMTLDAYDGFGSE